MTQASIETTPAPHVRDERAATFTFGTFESGERLCGRYHAPHGPVRGGVVLCSPGGVEDIWTYATYRVLAQKLAAQGFAVLRFDYHGQGDSSGCDRDPGRTRAWLDSISIAIDELSRRSGVATTTLFGVRLGATLAATVAAERGDIENLVLWAPLAGRTFLREFRAYRLLNPPAAAPAGRALPEGWEEAAGFELTAETVASLGALDPTKIARKPAARALLLKRDETSPEDKVAKAFEALGVTTTMQVGPGYTPMMIEPRKAVVPMATLDLVTEWLVAACPPLAQASAATNAGSTATSLLTRAPYSGVSVREEFVRFGPGKELFGVVTEPLEATDRGKTALVLLTIAAHHRVGANRMHVALAREAAALGFTVLRLDIRGIGESESKDGVPHPYAFEPVADVRAAMDLLEARGIRRFALSGLCSGAFLAYHATLRDRRVNSMILLNPQVFYFREGDSLDVGKQESFKSTRTYWDLLRKKETWQRALRGEIGVGLVASLLLARARRVVETRIDQVQERFGLAVSTKPNVRRDFEAICSRGAHAHLIFSAADEGVDYIEAHLGRQGGALRRHPTFELTLVEGPDHTFAPVWSQVMLAELICAHLVKHFGK
jgi:alpha-beta hydrolase superfamily lysophospholipase